MNTATILFTYNRPIHTQKVLEGLKNNTVLLDELYIFHDGYKNADDKCAWYEVEKIIRNVDWCRCNVETATANKGLANSIIYGVNKIFEKYDSIIVLEDDCVPLPLFIKYMTDALAKYSDNENVYCIGATNEPVEAPSNGTDAYFIGRINSWGWATWKDRWNNFERNYRLLGEVKNNEETREWYEIWGQDLEPAIIGDVLGTTDTWAAFWALSVIKRKGLCLAPYKSYVDNIGFDGSGIHSGNEKPQFNFVDTKDNEIVLPEKVEIIENYNNIFSDYYPWTDPKIRDGYYKDILLKWVDIENKREELKYWFDINNVNRVCIWGIGQIGERLIPALSEIISITAIVENSGSISEFEGIACINRNNIPQDIDRIIVIPGYDIEKIKKTVGPEIASIMIPIDVILDKPLPATKNTFGIKHIGSAYGGFAVDTNAIDKNGG